jgi:MSHA biogenesis protein MshP
VKGSRAYWAARAGLEWAIPQVIASNSCPAATSTFVVDAFNVQTSCVASTYNEGVTVTIVNITSLACQPGPPCGAGAGGGTAYVERSVSTAIER